MAEIVIMGAGLGGVIMAYEMRDQLRPGRPAHSRHKGPDIPFRPVEPMGGGELAQAREHRNRPRADLFAGAASTSAGPRLRRRSGSENARARGRLVAQLRSPRHRHRTRTRLRRDRGAGSPGGPRNSICHVDHAEKPRRRFEAVLQEAGADRHRRGARALPASARPTSIPSSSRPSCAAARFATTCR